MRKLILITLLFAVNTYIAEAQNKSCSHKKYTYDGYSEAKKMILLK